MEENIPQFQPEVERVKRSPLGGISTIPKGFLITSLPFFLTFVCGLGLGLVIHPPDQHEKEKGYILGFVDGSTDGFEKGKSLGMQEGAVIGEIAGYAAAEKAVIKQADEKIAGIQTEYRKSESAFTDLQKSFKTGMEQSEKKGFAAGFEKGIADKQLALAKLRDEHVKTLAVETKKARIEGEQSAGFEKWYNDGLAEGIARATKDCDIAKGDAVDMAREAAKQQSYESGKAEGYKAGEKAGKASAFQVGLDQGRSEGEAIGYRRGYKDGKDGRRGP